MTAKEFIKKWNVAYEDKEQELEFSLEMKADLQAYAESKAKEAWNAARELDKPLKHLRRLGFEKQKFKLCTKVQ